MEIKISNIYNNYVNLSCLIEEYEHNYLNMYNCLLETQNCWNSNKSIKFIKHIEDEKNKIKISCDELQDVKNIYEFILSKYSKFGNKIFFDKNNFSKVLTCFDICINLAEKILKKYYNLNLIGYSYEIDLIREQIELLKINIDKVKELKQNFEKNGNDIIATEEKINSMLSKIKISEIEESDVSEFI